MKLSSICLLTICSTLLSSLPQSACGQTRNSQPDWLSDLSKRITLNGYAQAGYAYQDQANAKTSDFNLKRTLLWAKADVTDRWSFLFMVDFNSEVQEFYTDYRLTADKALTVRVGQFKNSFSLENPMSPSSLELVDVCSQSVTYMAGCGSDPLMGKQFGRDIGLKLYGELFDGHLTYELGLMNGQGINCRDGNRDKDVIAKIDVRPIDGLRLVASGQKGRGHAVGTAAWNPGIAEGDNYTRDRYSVGAELKFGAYCPARYKEARPVSLRAEWLEGKDGEVKSRGAYLTTSVPLVDALDAVASVDWFDRNTAMRYDQTNATVGLQYWYYKKCRLQLQYTHTWRQFDSNYNNIQAQVQIAF